MAFETYKCDKYIDYLTADKKIREQIYKTLMASPFTYTQLGKAIGVDYYSISRYLKLQKLSDKNLLTLLQFIK